MSHRLLLALCLVLVYLTSATAAERVALVIGNGRYQGFGPLDTPADDAGAVAAGLVALGFSTIGPDGSPGTDALLDLRGDDFLLRIEDFAKAARGAEIAFLYFSGYGMQHERQSYLLPVDAPSNILPLIRRHGMAVEEILARLDGKARLTIAVFDACRPIPTLESSGPPQPNADSYRCLARVQTTGKGRIVAYSAPVGQLAPDPPGATRSPYTTALLNALARPDLEVGDLFRQVADRVGRAGSGQPPETLIEGVAPQRFYLAATPPQVPPAPVAGPPQASAAAGVSASTAPVASQNIPCAGGSTDLPCETSLQLSAVQRCDIQARLNALGYLCKVNGQFGPETRYALRAWQRQQQLPVTGYLDAAQQQRLGTALDTQEEEQLYRDSLASSSSADCRTSSPKRVPEPPHSDAPVTPVTPIKPVPAVSNGRIAKPKPIVKPPIKIPRYHKIPKPAPVPSGTQSRSLQNVDTPPPVPPPPVIDDAERKKRKAAQEFKNM